MKPEALSAAEAAAVADSAHEKTRSADTSLAEDQTPGLGVHDDGSVPEKQINRWTGEGGLWTPAD